MMIVALLLVPLYIIIKIADYPMEHSNFINWWSIISISLFIAGRAIYQSSAKKKDNWLTKLLRK